MAQTSLAKLCPNPSPTTPSQCAFSSLIQCSIHERDFLPSHYEKSIFLSFLVCFCLAITYAVLEGFQLVCFIFSKLCQDIDISLTDYKHRRKFKSKSTLKSKKMDPLSSDAHSSDGSDLSLEETMSSLDNMSSGNEADAEPPMDEEAEEDEETGSNGTCAYCFDEIYDEPIKPCTKCKRVCCSECVRAIFILAGRDESSMPPRCCRRPIQLAYGRLVLSHEEVEWFKEKYDEWNTADRCYCPVPSCSAFLNPRQFPELRVQFQQEDHKPGHEQDISDDQDESDEKHDLDSVHAAESRSEMSDDNADVGAPVLGPRPVIHCPKCTASICVQCMQLAHNDNRNCNRDDDMTAELTAALVGMRAKRCPKCRTAVRKSHGCNHMRCRCGAKWCWYCFRTIEECEDEQCVVAVEGPDLHDEIYTSDDDSDDGDRRGEGDGGLEDLIVFRPEYVSSVTLQDSAATNDASSAITPSESDRRTEEEYRVIPFNCLHHWYPIEDFESDATLAYNCERCWSPVYARLNNTTNSSAQQQQQAQPQSGPLTRERQLVIDGEEKSAYDVMQDHIMLRCWVCSQTICNKCRKHGF